MASSSGSENAPFTNHPYVTVSSVSSRTTSIINDENSTARNGSLLERRRSQLGSVAAGTPRPGKLSLPTATNLFPAASADDRHHKPTTVRRRPTTPVSIPSNNPIHRRNTSPRPTTPLSGRPENARHLSCHQLASERAHPLYSNFRHQQHHRPLQRLNRASSINMRADDSSPLYTPSSPLSPIMNPSVPPVPPHLTTRSSKKTNSLRLPNLGRFHPTTCQSPPPSSENMPKHGTQTSSPKRYSHSRQYSGAQKALHNYQRELIASATRSSRSVSTSNYKPLSPRLIPLGSPGPVTPLVLEEDGGYLVAGAVGPGTGLGEGGHRELVERLIREEEERRNSSQAGRASPVPPAGG